MVIRSTVGALATVAVMGAIALALPERSGSTPVAGKPVAPFGGLASSGTVAVQPPAMDPRATSGEVKSVAPENPSVASDLKPRALPIAFVSDMRSVQPPSSPAVAPVPAAPSVPAQPSTAPDQVALVTPMPARDDIRPVDTMRPSSLVNINTASVEALNKLPGGRMGRTIAAHRPYRSVDDLVRKRVLRDSALRRIRPLIATE